MTTDQALSQQSLHSLLVSQSRVLEELGPAFAREAETLMVLAERLAEGRFHLAVLGQFKRGKSTLQNALLGEDFLPSSVLPLTAIPTFITAGPSRQVRVVFLDSRPDLVLEAADGAEVRDHLIRFAAEEGNPKNTLGVERVEVSHPSRLLSAGLMLIDTPGIGSTLAHNTETTMVFLHECDAALFVISADPPITETEVSFLREIMTIVPRIFFIQNKSDMLNQDDLDRTVRFFSTVLTEQAGVRGEPEIFPISASQGLLARRSGDQELWEASGCARVEEYLQTFLIEEKQLTLTAAIRAHAMQVLQVALFQVRLHERLLTIPIRDLEEKGAVFEETLTAIQRERDRTVDILAGEQQRVLGLLQEHADHLRAQYAGELTAQADLALTWSGMLDEAAALETIAGGVAASFPREMEATTGLMEKELTVRLQQCQEEAGRLTRTVQSAAAELFLIPDPLTVTGHQLPGARKPYWVEYDWTLASSGPLPPDLLERALPRSMRERRVRERLRRQIEGVVRANVENLRWATLQNVNAAFLQMTREMDENLTAVIAATRGAITAAREQRTLRKEEIHEEVSRLQRAAAGIEISVQSLKTES
jgi:hypothetical protein